MANDLANIRKQIAQLERKAEAIVKAEAKGVIAKVKELITRYGLTSSDLGFAGKRQTRASATRGAFKSKKAAKQTVGVPMYRDPASGKTWTGRGKPPNWIAGAKDRTAYLIDSPAKSNDLGAASKATSPDVAVTAKPARTTRKATSKAPKKAQARKSPLAAAVVPATKKATPLRKLANKPTSAPKKASKTVATAKQIKKAARRTNKSGSAAAEAAGAVSATGA